MSDDLVQRLRAFCTPTEEAEEAADRIEALEARTRALEEALRSAPHDFVSGCDADDGYHECNCYKAALDA